MRGFDQKRIFGDNICDTYVNCWSPECFIDIQSFYSVYMYWLLSEVVNRGKTDNTMSTRKRYRWETIICQTTQKVATRSHLINGMKSGATKG